MRKIPRRWATEVKTRVLKTILRQLHLRQKALEFLTKTEDNYMFCEEVPLLLNGLRDQRK